MFAQDVPYGMKAYVRNDQSNACVAGTTRSVNASCSDVITVPLFFSPPLPPPPPTFESYNPRRPFPRYIWSWSVEQNARDTQMTTRVTEGARRERHARENGLSRSSDFLAWKLKCWQARHVKRDLRVCLNNRGFPTALFKAHLMHCIELESILN